MALFLIRLAAAAQGGHGGGGNGSGHHGGGGHHGGWHRGGHVLLGLGYGAAWYYSWYYPPPYYNYPPTGGIPSSPVYIEQANEPQSYY